MSAAKKKSQWQLTTAVLDLLITAVAAARALLSVLPFIAGTALSAYLTGYRLRKAQTKCAVCGLEFSRKHVFRLHVEAGWVCADCYSLFNDGNRVLHRAALVHAGIVPPEESAA